MTAVEAAGPLATPRPKTGQPLRPNGSSEGSPESAALALFRFVKGTLRAKVGQKFSGCVGVLEAKRPCFQGLFQ